MACTLISETCPYKQKVLHWSLITPVRIITTFSIVPKVAAFAAAQKQAVAMFAFPLVNGGWVGPALEALLAASKTTC
jgi:hypothetical protein